MWQLAFDITDGLRAADISSPQRVPFRPCVFTAVWNCSVNLMLHDGNCEKRSNFQGWSLFSFSQNIPSKKKKKKTRGGHNVIYFMSPLGELDAQLQLWDTLSCNGKRFLLVASQGHHLVSLWLWLASVNFSFVVSVVWRKRKVHKSHRRVTNRCLTLARPVVCISHFVLWI